MAEHDDGDSPEVEARALGICLEMTARGVERDVLLRALRGAGVSKLGALKALVEAGVCDFDAAKEALATSPVWADVRARAAALLRETNKRR